MSEFSVKKPYTVLVGVVLAIVLGVVSFTKTTMDLLPNISLPYVIVVTTYPGANPETVEMVVTQPVEAGMATVSNIETIQSISAENYSMVILEFAQSTNMDSVSLEIREKLDQIKGYWNDSVSNPMIMKLNPNMLPVMIAAVGVAGKDDAEISAYVQDELVPELESIEGVASSSTTGLLEKSVNVIIRREKVDEMNARIRAAIDEKMKDAEQEIADGRKKIEDGQKELTDGKQKLIDGKKGLADGEKQLEDGKKQLTDKQAETLNTLASTKTTLLTAKSQLESTKVTIGLAKSVVDPLLEKVLEAEKKLEEYDQQINDMIPSRSELENEIRNNVSQAVMQPTAAPDQGDSDQGDSDQSEKTEVDALIHESIQNSESAQNTGDTTDRENETPYENGEAESQPQNNEEVSNSDSGNSHENATDPNLLEEYRENLRQIFISWREEILANQWLRDAAQHSEELSKALERLENTDPNAEPKLLLASIKETLQTFQNTLNTTSATLDSNLVTVNQGLEAVEKGELTAAIEFANASVGISLGEYKMEMTKSQLDAADEQIKTGQEQLDQALEKLEEGEKQLDDARESAYEQADMKNILSVATIEGLLTAQNFSMPAGYVTEEGASYLVRVGDKPSSVEEMEKLPLIDLHMDGVDIIRLEDVADVFYTDNSDAIYTNVNGSGGVILSLQKQTGYSTGDVSDRVKKRFGELMEETPDLKIITLMDQGVYIDLVMDSIGKNILFGAALSILILLLFLKDLRPTLIVAFSIPISIVTAVVCMYFSGVTMNVISLSGLALGIGMLVDNSIVVIENIYRLRVEGASMKDAAMAGAKEVAGAIVASTLTTVCVFLPIVFTEGITRQLFVDMGLTIAYSLFASLAVALTVVPAMASKILTGAEVKKEGRFFSSLTKGYSALLRISLRAKVVVFTLVVALLGISVVAALSRGTAFMPEMDSTQMTVNVKLDKDATLAETADVTNHIMQEILKIEDVEDAGAMLSSGTSLLGNFGGGTSTNATSIYVVTKEKKKMNNEEIAADIMERVKDLPATVTVDTSTMDMSALGGSGITVQVRGRDLDMLRKIAGEVATIVKEVDGTANVSDGLAETGAEFRIHVNKEEAVKYGLTVAQVFAQTAERVATANSSTVLSGNDQDYSVYVTNDSDTELTRKLLEEIEIKGTDENKAQVKVPLRDIATFEDTKSLNSINRIDQSRYISVSAEIAEGYNVGLVAAELEKKMESYQVPAGYRLVYSGENETINDAMEQLVLMLLLAIVFMYLIMVAQFQSLLSPFIIMFTIPLAFTGGFLGLYVSRSELSVIAMIGFVMLSGVIVNNGIVLIDYINQLIEGGMERVEAITTAGRTRLRPVLMTALTTILALSTMAFSDDMGAAMSKPMAVVTIGGLLYGTLLTLIVIPCVYDVFAKGREKRVKKI